MRDEHSLPAGDGGGRRLRHPPDGRRARPDRRRNAGRRRGRCGGLRDGLLIAARLRSIARALREREFDRGVRRPHRFGDRRVRLPRLGLSFSLGALLLLGGGLKRPRRDVVRRGGRRQRKRRELDGDDWAQVLPRGKGKQDKSMRRDDERRAGAPAQQAGRRACMTVCMIKRRVAHGLRCSASSPTSATLR